MNRFSLRSKFVRLLAVSVTFAAAACGAETQGPDSNTNWLSRCVEDSDCRGGLSCICNTCTVACNDDDECGPAGARVSCVDASDLSCEASGSVCARASDVPADEPLPRPEDAAREVLISDAMCDGQPHVDTFAPGYTPSRGVVEEARGLLSEMSMAQKVVQLTGGGEPDYDDPDRWTHTHHARNDAALGLRGHLWQSGAHGVCLEDLPERDARFATSFPVGVAQGASFDLELVSRVGRAIGDEATAAGGTVLLAPMLSILRHPLWGRAQESFGEDPFHVGRMGSAFTTGAQKYISACAGHFLGNTVESGRHENDARMDEQTLREIYARPFEMAIRDGGIGCIMAAYNAVNGTKSTENAHLLREVLREDLGFRGMVISDWWAMTAPEGGQGPSDAPEDGLVATEAMTATLDVEVPWAVNYDALPRLVSDGSLDEALVDHAVARVLEQKLRFRTAYQDEPIGRREPETTFDARGAVANPDEHLDLAEELALKSMVLLKNDGVLPLSSVLRVAVLGARVPYVVDTDTPSEGIFDFARDAALGDRGSNRVRIDPERAVGPFAGIQAAAGRTVVTTGESAEAAVDADVVVAVVGLTPGDEGEEYTGVGDRSNLSLGAEQNQLVEDALALGKPVVVVVQAGGAVEMPWLDRVNAVVMAWYPGQMGGAALGKLLFGQENWSGRLPVSWPVDLAQFPDFVEGRRIELDYHTGYRHFDAQGLTPLFPFGHGLSYTRTSYERVSSGCARTTKEGVVALDVELRHEEGPAGEEVVLVFASYPETNARRPARELKAFARVGVAPGETSRLTVPVRVADLAYFDADRNEWVIESGPVLFQIGPGAADLPLTAVVEIE